MTEQNPATFLQGGTHPAEGIRRMLTSIAGGTAGIVSLGDLAVTQRGAGANMSVDVAGGKAWIAGSEATYQGMYHVENRSTTNLVIGAADATDPRIDLIVAKVEDSDYSGATDAWSLAVVAGTPAPSPSVPAAPANSISLAQVAVAALATSIVTANITDLRDPNGSTDFTPTVPGLTVGNGSWDEAWYQRVGDIVTVGATFTFGSTSSMSSLGITLPIESAVIGEVKGVAQLTDSGGLVYPASLTSGNTTTVSISSHAVSGSDVVNSNVDATNPFTWTTNDSFSFIITYRAKA